MARARAKKKRQNEIAELFDATAQRKAERAVQKHVMEMDERSEEREQYVKVILAANDESVHEIVNLMVNALIQMEGDPRIFYNGQTYNAIKGEADLLERTQVRNFRWVAVRCLVALAEWDIRIGNFKLPESECARCGVKVRQTRKKVRRGN